MSNPIDYSYVGVGKVYLREVGALAGLVDVGNCSALSFSISETVKELLDFTQVGGGTYNEVRRIQSVEVSMILHDLSPANLSRALYGAATGVTSAAVTAQAMGAGYIGAFLPFPSLALATPAPVIRASNGVTAGVRANSVAVTVGQYLVPATANAYYYRVSIAGTTGAAPPTFPTTPGATVVDGTATLTCMGRIILTLATDYVVRPNGVLLLVGAHVTDGEAIEGDFTRAASDVLQALVNNSKEYEMYFEGLNEARNGKTVIVQAYRVKIGATQSLALIGEDFEGLELTGKVLKDTTKVGAGISQYFKAELVR